MEAAERRGEIRGSLFAGKSLFVGKSLILKKALLLLQRNALRALDGHVTDGVGQFFNRVRAVLLLGHKEVGRIVDQPVVRSVNGPEAFQGRGHGLEGGFDVRVSRRGDSVFRGVVGGPLHPGNVPSGLYELAAEGFGQAYILFETLKIFLILQRDPSRRYAGDFEAGFFYDPCDSDHLLGRRVQRDLGLSQFHSLVPDVPGRRDKVRHGKLAISVIHLEHPAGKG